MINLSKTFLHLFLKLTVLFICLCTLQIEAQKRGTSVNINSDGKTTISVKNGKSNDFSLEYEGDITISDDDKDVIAISNNGYMEIKKSAFGSRRRIFIEPGSNGSLIKKYYVGSSEKNFDPDGRKWLAEILPEVLRSSTLGASERVDRFYKKGGTYAVLQEVGQIDSDFVKAAYIKLLLDKNPKSSDLITILEVVGTDIDSDHHKAEILKRNTKAFLDSEAATSAYIKTAGRINSDHHKAEVLKKSIRDGAISEAQMKSLFAITEGINSDHHKAQILMEVMKNRSLSGANVELLISTARNINSDHHKSNVLQAALSNPGLSESGYSAFLETISNINSDHHSANIISALLNKELDSNSLQRLLELADRNMNSDHHKSNVIKKVIQKQSLGDGNLEVLLTALKNMNSDHNQSVVFKQLAKESFTEAQLTSILNATKSMNSDHNQTESLLAFSGVVKDKVDAVKEAYRDACSSISSELHYGRALRAIE